VFQNLQFHRYKKDGSPVELLNMPFDSPVTDSTADAVLDYSGSGHHGTLGSGGYMPTWTSSASCVKGGCYSFDGTTGDNVNLGND